MKPGVRIRLGRDETPRPGATHVLYWMIGARRTRSSFGLDRAIAWSKELSLPLWVLEPIALRNPWASERVFAFVRDGMRDNARRFESSPIGYLPALETEAGEHDDLLVRMAKRAALVVTDEVPSAHGPAILRAAARVLTCRMEIVDGDGMVPLRTPDRSFSRAVDLRRWLQRNPDRWLLDAPRVDPLARLDLPRAGGGVPGVGAKRAANIVKAATASDLSALEYPQSAPAVDEKGGEREARSRLKRFVRDRLDGYAERRNDPAPEVAGASALSAHLHFGHVGAHAVVRQVLKHEDWDPSRVDHTVRARGAREGWWNVRPGAEAFLDQVITWRELGRLYAWREPRHREYGSLPEWSRRTLAEHASDLRPYLYTLAELDRAATHDEVWNAAQRELVGTGRIHNYLRMLWGKKILEWSRTPEDAFRTMLELNDRYALDGRDPNSYSGIGWVLGRFDRAWGPLRPIFGSVRYMSSDNTRRKLKLRGYLERFGPGGQQLELGGSPLRR